MVEVVRTDEFDEWIRKLKDKAGKLRILKRIDRLANGNLAMPALSAGACRNYGSTWDRATASTTCKTETG